MSLFTKLVEAVQSWRRRRGERANRNRAGVMLEQLDHRQLMAVNFTGNVVIDFPATMRPGVVVLPNDPSVIHPIIPPSLSSEVRVSGLDVSGIRLTYTPGDDTLSIGLEQPDNQKDGRPVIAGDTDNSGDSASVSPAVSAIEPAFIDFADLGGSETMGAFLDLDRNGLADVVAGVSNDVGAPKTYQVANAVVNPAFPNAIPGFGTKLTANTGNVYLVNDPDHPNFQFSIRNFSQLYTSRTGLPFTPDTTVNVGAFGNSNDDDGISEAFFPGRAVRIGDATPPPPPVCPPVSPPILINPHESKHVNIAHASPIRAYVFGTSGFDVRDIDPDTVRLNGAAPIPGLNAIKRINGDEFPDARFVFNGLDLDLPPGFTDATLTGSTTDGKTFSSSVRVFVRDESSYSPAEIAARDRRLENAGDVNEVIIRKVQARHPVAEAGAFKAKGVESKARVATPADRAGEATAKTVKIPMRSGASAIRHVEMPVEQPKTTVSIPKRNVKATVAAKAATPAPKMNHATAFRTPQRVKFAS